MRASARGLMALLAVVLSTAAMAETLPFLKDGKIDRERWYLADGWANGDHQACEWRADAVALNERGATFTVSDKSGNVRPIGCAEMQTKTVNGYGTYTARIKSAAGVGLNTAFFTYIGPPKLAKKDHSEIDFEFLGKNPRTVQLNFFHEGVSQGLKLIDLGFDASADFHEYSFVWEPNRIRWYVDGKLVYTTPPGAKIPPNPGRIYLSLWASTENLKDWMGTFTYTKPVTAEVEWVRFEPLPAQP